MLLAANFVLSGQLAWTPGGYGIAFGRMLEDGIVKRYLDGHCPDARLKLCPYRNELNRRRLPVELRYSQRPRPLQRAQGGNALKCPAQHARVSAAAG